MLFIQDWLWWLCCLYMFQVKATTINVTNLMTEYLKGCGEYYTCSYRNSELSQELNATDIRTCPFCSCDDDCFRNRDCCPDKFFNQIYTVFHSPVIAMSSPEEKIPKWRMINYCPNNRMNAEKILCEKKSTAVELFAIPPYTSLTSNLTYVNKHCAICNNETERNLREWQWKFSYCQKEIFYLSSVEDIIGYTDTYYCEIMFDPGEKLNDFVQQNLYRNYMNHKKCNETGTWSSYNVDVQLACESSYDVPYRTNQNVFCYMCNPPKKSIPIVSVCNETGEWNMYSESIEKECENRGYSEMTYPYKNIYCFICNRRQYKSNQTSTNEMRFHDFTASMTEWYQFGKYLIKVKHLRFRQHVIQQVIQSEMFPNYDKEMEPKTIQRQVKEFNLTGLLLKMFALYPFAYCNDDFIPSTAKRNIDLESCECNPQCLFQEPCKCCPDIALMFPVICQSYAVPKFVASEGRATYLITNGCVGNRTSLSNTAEYKAIKQLCEEGSNLFDPFPVNNDDISYKNIFCFLCNSDFKTPILIENDDYDTWNFIIECDNELPYHFLNNLNDLLREIKERKCNLLYDTQNSVVCNHLQDSKSNCSASAAEDLKWACQDTIPTLFSSYKGYKNKFCYICNPTEEEPTSGFLRNCSGNGNEIYAEACDALPTAGFFTDIYPYKNVFCKLCSSNCTKPHSCITDDASARNCKSTFGRNLRIPNMFQSEMFRPGLTFNVSSVVRQPIDPNIHCYPGKAYVNGRCRRIINALPSATYALHINADLQISSDAIPSNYTFTPIKNKIKDILQRKVNALDHYMTSFFLLTKLSNDVLNTADNQGHDASLCSIIFMQVLAYDSKNVENLESILNDFRTSLMINDSFLLYENVVNIVVKVTNGSNNHMCVDTTSAEYESYSKHMKLMDFFSSLIYVTNLLFCVHERFDKGKFHFDGLAAVNNESGLVYDVGEFIITNDDMISVCKVSTREGYLKSDIQLPEKPFSVKGSTIFVADALSLLCLSVILINFCINKYKDDIVSIIVTSFILALVCLHATSAVHRVLADQDVICTILAFGKKFFTLLSEFCLLSFSFHLSVFSSSTESRTEDKYALCRKKIAYLSFGCCCPILILVLGFILNIYIEGDATHVYLCVLPNPMSNDVLTFIVPLLAVLFAHLIFLILASRKIHLFGDIKPDFIFLVKISIVTGVSWCTQTLDAFLDVEVIWFISALVGSSQGIGIFLAYISSYKVLPTPSESGKTTVFKTVTTTTDIVSSSVVHPSISVD